MSVIKNISPLKGGFKVTILNESGQTNPNITSSDYVLLTAIDLDKPFIRADEVQSVKVNTYGSPINISSESGDFAIFSGTGICCQPFIGSKHGMMLNLNFYYSNKFELIFYHQLMPAFRFLTS